MSNPSPETLDELLERMRARCDKATKGPWKVVGNGRDAAIIGPPRTTRKGDGTPKPVKGSEARIVSLDNTAGCGDESCCANDPFVAISPADASFMAAARTDLPAALSALKVARERLQLTNERLSDEHARCRFNARAITAAQFEATYRELLDGYNAADDAAINAALRGEEQGR